MLESIPYTLSPTDMPIDISFAFGNEKPAGKHGFMKAVGDHFEFEDGTVARFWGVCLNGAANFPPHDHAEKLAKRLSKMGVNIVRLHQLDGDYATPNIFQFERGQVLETTRHFDPRSLERLDYLIKCLIEEGIYINVDNLCFRRFKSGDDIENSSQMLYAGPGALYNRHMIALQKEYTKNLFTHVNQYTGRAFKDEPAVVMAGIINEGTLFKPCVCIEPYYSEFKENCQKWLDEKGIDFDLENYNLFGKCDEAPIVEYKMEVEKAYFKEMRDHMREIGVKIPVSGGNYIQHAALFASSNDMDFCENHCYLHRILKEGLSGTTWTEKVKESESFALTSCGDGGFSKLFHMRDLNKPMMVTEWNMTWPNFYRAEGPLLYAAMASLQGLSGVSIHTYSYANVQTDDMRLGKEFMADGLWGVAYREGVFSAWRDPAIIGLFPHAALILRRGDVAESKKKIAIVADPINSRKRVEWLKDMPKPLDWYLERRFDWMSPCYFGLAEVSKVGTCLTPPADADVVYTEPQWPMDMDKHELLSDNGQMYRNWDKNIGWIDTDMSKVVYGFMEKNGKIELDGLSIEAESDFGVIALSSLSNDPICKSNNILMTTVGRAENTGAQFEGNIMTEFGQLPVRVEVIKAKINLKTNRDNLRIYSITEKGMIHGIIPAEYKDGVLSFEIGQNWRSMYYLIQTN